MGVNRFNRFNRFRRFRRFRRFALCDQSHTFDYRLALLKQDTASELLGRAEADGYRVATLLSDIVVFERSETK